MKKRLLFALILMGFTSLAVQVLLIREFLVTFYGNELTIGLVMACWIISEAFGSGIASRFSNKLRSPSLFYASLQAMIAIYLPISIFLIRGVKIFFTTTPGEAVGIIPIFLSSLLIIGPLSIFDGMQFPFGCRLYAQHTKKEEQTAGRVYILEAIGFILAGPVLTYVFLTRFNSFQVGFLICIINLVSALSLIAVGGIASLRGGQRPTKQSVFEIASLISFARNDSERFLKKLLVCIILILLALNIYFLTSNAALKLHNDSVALQWKGQNIVEYKNSIYGNLAVSQKQEQYTFYSDGAPIMNIPTPDIIWTQDFVHFGLLSHPRPKEVLFLSGGAGGPIAEALKHPVDRIDYAELDPLLITLIKKFPKAITEAELSDPRVNLKITDGVRFIKKTSSKYDVIFVNLPAPATLQLNRYYTKEFFIRLKEILNPGGRIVLALPGSLSYLNEELKELNLCVLNTLKDVFPYVSVIPGDNNLYISSSLPLEVTPEIIMERLRERNISTNVFTESYVAYRLKTSWQDWFYENLGKAKARENKNLAPTGVFYSIAYWNSLFTPHLRGFFRAIGELNFNCFILCLIIFEILLFIVIASLRRRRSNHKKRDCFDASRLAMTGMNFSIATTGFVGMSFYLIFILSYQVFFGYVYHHIALLVTSFMAGLAIGGWLVTKNLERFKNGLRWFIGMELSVIAFCLVSLFFLAYINNVKEFGFYPVFFILSGLSGLLVGAEFPLANKLCRQNAGPVTSTLEKTAGILYAMDLLGSFFAALLVSLVFLPIFGVLKTCLFLAILKTAGLILLPRFVSDSK